VSLDSPCRGDVWTIDLGTACGSEQAGLRPALIIQNDVGNRHAATTIIAAISSTIKLYPVTVPVKRREGGLRKNSMVNLAQVLTIDKSRLKKKLGKLSPVTMAVVGRAIRISLGVS